MVTEVSTDCCNVFYQANFRFGCEEVQIDIEFWLAKANQKTHKRYWAVSELTMWYGLKAREIKNKQPIKNNVK